MNNAQNKLSIFAELIVSLQIASHLIVIQLTINKCFLFV